MIVLLDHESNSDEKINNCVVHADEAASGSLIYTEYYNNKFKKKV